jgi:hypothetical protein
VRRLSRAAWLALAAHLLAAMAMLLILRRGLETNPDLADRMRFIAEHRGLWTAAWLSWTAAGPSILYFYFCLSKAHKLRPPWSWATTATVGAVILDWPAQRIEISTLPPVALAGDAPLFLVMHRFAVLLTGGGANGLYTAGALLLVLATRREYPNNTVRAGFGVVFFGLLLSAAALANSPAGMVLANAGLVPCLIVWLGGTALTASRREG